MRDARRIPTALAATTDAGIGLPRMFAAEGDAEFRTHPGLVAAAREDLDHAAHRLRAVQGRQRPAHDLDALDLRHRDIPDRRHAIGRRADLDPIHQHQHLARAGAAQEQARDLARPALVVDGKAGLAAQQVGERGRLQALDLGAVDDGARGERVGAAIAARAGHDDAIQRGRGSLLRGRHRREGMRDRHGKRSVGEDGTRGHR